MASSSEIEQIKLRANIVDVVGRYVPLKRYGSIWRGLCPFHTEKTPSFTVSGDRQAWHCFGCGQGGDVFSFLQQIEGWSFPETLEHLSRLTGVVLTERGPKRPGPALDVKERLFQAMAFAADTWRAELAMPGNTGSAYLSSRGVSAEMINAFGLGYAPDSWDTLVRAAGSVRISMEDLKTVGVVFKSTKNGNYYDRFRSRLMVPLRDVQGKVIACTGRWIGEGETDEGKYVNSPEHPVFHKGSHVFGLDLARQEIKRRGFAVLVEGNFDVIASHQVGFSNTIGVSGTACTEDQLRLIGRYAKHIALAFDQDSAGVAASFKTAILAWRLGFAVDAVVWRSDDAKDPDELIRKNGGKWSYAIEHKMPFMEYAFGILQQKYPPSTGENKDLLVQECARLLAALPSPIQSDHYIAMLADIVRSPKRLIIDVVQTHKAGGTIKPTGAEQPDVVRDYAALFAAWVSSDIISALFDSHEVVVAALPDPWKHLYEILFQDYTVATHSWRPEGRLERLVAESDDTNIDTKRAAQQTLVALETLREDHVRAESIRVLAVQLLIRWKRAYLTNALAAARTELTQAEMRHDASSVSGSLSRIAQLQKDLAALHANDF